MGLFLGQEATEKVSVLRIANADTEVGSSSVMVHKALFKTSVAPQQLFQTSRGHHRLELGRSRRHSQLQHVLDNALGMLHFFHNLMAEAVGAGLVSPLGEKTGLGHILLHSGEFQAQGAAQISKNAVMKAGHGEQKQTDKSEINCAGGRH